MISCRQSDLFKRLKETPTFISKDGSKYWFKNNKFDKEKILLKSDKDYINIPYAQVCGILHRENGPAIEYADGDRFWFINNKLHREDGPAEIRVEYEICYYLNDKEYSKEEYYALTPEERKSKRPL